MAHHYCSHQLKQRAEDTWASTQIPVPQLATSMIPQGDFPADLIFLSFTDTLTVSEYWLYKCCTLCFSINCTRVLTTCKMGRPLLTSFYRWKHWGSYKWSFGVINREWGASKDPAGPASSMALLFWLESERGKGTRSEPGFPGEMGIWGNCGNTENH